MGRLKLGRDQHNLKSNILALSISNPYRSCGAVSVRNELYGPQSHSAAWIESPTVGLPSKLPIQALDRFALGQRVSSGLAVWANALRQVEGNSFRRFAHMAAGAGSPEPCALAGQNAGVGRVVHPRCGGDHSAVGLEDLGLANLPLYPATDGLLRSWRCNGGVTGFPRRGASLTTARASMSKMQTAGRHLPKIAVA